MRAECEWVVGGIEVGSIYTHGEGVNWMWIPRHPTHGCHVSMGEHAIDILTTHEQLLSLLIVLVAIDLVRRLLSSIWLLN